MTLETSDPNFERIAALCDRAAVARQHAAAACRRAAAACGDAARFAEVLGVTCDSFAAEATSVARARTRVVKRAEQAGVTGERLEAIRLAVSEAASNVVIHAYPDGPGEFRVRTAMVGGRLTVRVADDGRGPDAPSTHPGLGYGLQLISASSDSSAVKRRTHGGTEVVMRWTITNSRPSLLPASTSARL